MDLDVILETPEWDVLPLEDISERAARATFDELGLVAQEVELCVMGCSDARIAELNSEFRGKPTPTNVLSWPAQDLEPPTLPEPDVTGCIVLGDIALAFGVCEKEANTAAKSLESHVTHLVVHAILHLLGYHHETDAQAALMEGLERTILKSLGLPNPYA